jgi:23S rRNA (cytosine1962-C5)-methyltransferase
MISQIFLKRGKAGPTIGRHPWLFSSAIERIEGKPTLGDEVAIYKAEDATFLGYGLFNPTSQICTRVYSWDESQRLDQSFWKRQLSRALDLRKKILAFGPGESIRLVFSEADFLSGLTVDRFGDFLSVNFSSAALFTKKATILEVLQELTAAKGMLVRCDRSVAKQEGLEQDDQIVGVLPETDFAILENGSQHMISLRSGQKTGFYLDQKLNRARIMELAKGRRVLDLFSYSGGFSLASARAGAEKVWAVDSSEPAIELARQSANLNGYSQVEFFCEDVFEFMRSHQKDRFDLVIVDPPKLATSRKFKNNALRKYFRINEEALKLVEPGGCYFTFSCSGQISRDEFFSMLASAARRAKRDVQILDQVGASPDHPISTACPESAYLKGILARVL